MRTFPLSLRTSLRNLERFCPHFEILARSGPEGMVMSKKSVFVLILNSFLGVSAGNTQDLAPAESQARQAGNIQTTDYLVPHISTVPANYGKRVELFAREKVKSGRAGKAPVVLM